MSHKQRLIVNFLSLSSIQAVNTFLPLLTIPYLVRMLGPEKFGLIAFAQACIQYFILFTDYGFNLSATRKVSLARESPSELSKIFSVVMSIKFLLIVLGFIILSVLVFSFSKFREAWSIYLLTYGMVIGNAFFPVWFFQGVEAMKQIAALNFLSRIIFLVAIFACVHHQKDYIYVPLLNAFGFMVTGILGFILAMIRFKIAWHWPSPREIGTELVEGWQIFVSMLSTSLYTMSNAFILGIFTNNTMVGYYSAGEKVVKGIQGLLAPLSQTIYPHVSRLTLESRESAFRFLRKMIRLVGSTTFIGSLILFILAHPIGIFILGNNFQESILVIRCLAFLPFLVALSNIFGVQIMLNFGLKNLFMRILIMAGILDIILAILLGPTLKYIGISIASLITECFVTVTMLIVLIKKRLPVFRES